MRSELALAGAQGDVRQRLRVAQVLGGGEEGGVVVVPLQAIVFRGGRHDGRVAASKLTSNDLKVTSKDLLTASEVKIQLSDSVLTNKNSLLSSLSSPLPQINNVNKSAPEVLFLVYYRLKFLDTRPNPKPSLFL